MTRITVEESENLMAFENLNIGEWFDLDGGIAQKYADSQIDPNTFHYIEDEVRKIDCSGRVVSVIEHIIIKKG